jgi:chromate reductase
MSKKIAVLVGSLRKESFNRKVAKEIMKNSPKSLEMEIIDISQLPIYNQDDDEGSSVPVAWTKFRDQIKKFDAVLFVTPEYNRSMPAVLKNAIDVGSRPYGKSVWDGKPAAIISVSPGAIGGFGANHHLRQSLVFLNMPCMQMPEAYIGNVSNVIDKEGVINPSTVEFLGKFIGSFEKWVNVHVPMAAH